MSFVNSFPLLTILRETLKTGQGTIHGFNGIYQYLISYFSNNRGGFYHPKSIEAEFYGGGAGRPVRS
jgi:hypothetical protein